MAEGKHFVGHASVETWQHRLLYRVLGASSKTYDGAILHGSCFAGTRLAPQKIKHMKNVIGPDTCLWAFLKAEHGKVKLYSPFFAIGPPDINLIEDGLLGQFTA